MLLFLTIYNQLSNVTDNFNIINTNFGFNYVKNY